VYLFVRPFYYYNANRGISVKALYVLKMNCPCWFKEKKKKKKKKDIHIFCCEIYCL
jgi:hypothetical protein